MAIFYISFYTAYTRSHILRTMATLSMQSVELANVLVWCVGVCVCFFAKFDNNDRTMYLQYIHHSQNVTE